MVSHAKIEGSKLQATRRESMRLMIVHSANHCRGFSFPMLDKKAERLGSMRLLLDGGTIPYHDRSRSTAPIREKLCCTALLL